MNTTIQHQFFYAHPAAAVWEYLTDPELMRLWLMPNNFLPILGHDFQFTTKPMPALELDGVFHCKVLEIIPFKKLSYSWKGGSGNGQMSLDSLVVWTLLEKDNGTEVQLVHSGFKEIENLDIFTGMNAGWLGKLQKIDNLINATDGTAKL